MRLKQLACTFVLLAASFLPLAGCSSKPSAPPATGFLSSYANLAPAGESTLRYTGTSFAAYDAFIIDPVEVYFHQKAEGRDLSMANRREAATYARGSLIVALKDSYSIVNQPGRGVARIRMAITDIQKSTTALNVLPQTRMAGLGLGGASMEAEIIDSVTGEQIGAIVESRMAKRLDLLAGWSEMGDAESVIDFWSMRLRERFDDAHRR